MRIYIDDEYRCHVSDGDGLRLVETDAFEGECAEYIEGFRFVPAGETWTRADGTVFRGEMISPWKPYAQLVAVRDAVRRNDAERDAELAALIEEIYQEDMEMFDE